MRLALKSSSLSDKKDDEQSMPELVWGPPQQHPWWYPDSVAKNF